MGAVNATVRRMTGAPRRKGSTLAALYGLR